LIELEVAVDRDSRGARRRRVEAVGLRDRTELEQLKFDRAGSTRRTSSAPSAPVSSKAALPQSVATPRTLPSASTEIRTREPGMPSKAPLK